MLLAIDIGNTNIVFGLLDEGNLVFTSRIETNKNANSFLDDLKQVLDSFNITIDSIEASIISSVVPELNNQIKNDLNKLFNKKVYLVDSNIKSCLKIKIDNPSSLGSDRICDAVAVIEEYKVPAIIIDMGTATTISIIDEDKNYIGGMIIPGIKTSLDALSTKASKLPNITLDEPNGLIGKNTIDCMKSGIIYSNTCLIDGLIDKIKEELGNDYYIYSTGGLSRFIIKYSKHNIIYDENLLLKGLYYIYNKNK